MLVLRGAVVDRRRHRAECKRYTTLRRRSRGGIDGDTAGRALRGGDTRCIAATAAYYRGSPIHEESLLR
jgi:hypothetical protein